MNTSRFRIGTAPIRWGACEIPKWGDQLPYAQVLDEMAACGYEGTELGPGRTCMKDLRREVRADALARQLDFRDAVGLDVFAPLGEGSLDLRGTLSALRAVGYAGWLIVEQDVRLRVSPRAAPKQDAQRSRVYLREVLGA